ncbi:putative wall-associated receptor kinase-like protein 16 [Cinnamomum micranthum f. kanehirae]|uniref:Putative wall-associated receptor kinase-like protein 16 n=1 Tax=Cinnamomum micranthum f. kanehirae TaxID=337451 RepID=A0A443NKE2_9MAGN|nr:putative wall-associated receptor kinase-like protein 16 [Cinnamomum micranthum f. kanehirae]
MSSIFLLQLILLAAASSASDTKPGCPDTCGNVTVPYPFGIKDGCSIDEDWFYLTCNYSYTPPKLLLGSYEVVNITLQGQLEVNNFISSDCNDESGSLYSSSWWMTLNRNAPFTFSYTRNKFTAIGCDTIALITGSSGRNFTSGCVSFCSDDGSVTNNSCSGIGCCQTPIPMGAKMFEVKVRSSKNHSEVLGFNPCSFAFLIDQEKFKFSVTDLSRTSSYNKTTLVPVVIDWAIGNGTCESARRDAATFACVSENSNCSDSSDGPGYRCSCSQDIDECEENTYDCRGGKCKNTEGSYSCTSDNKLLKVILVRLSASRPWHWSASRGAVDGLSPAEAVIH